MSYAIYVGKNLTHSGVAFLAGYGDEPSSHWLEVVPRTTHAAGSSIVVGATDKADLPGVLSEIPQATETASHVRVCYSFYKGTPAPLTNGGLNEYGVAVRDVWSPSRPELVAMTPTTQSGPNYSELCRIVLERAKSAREGVELIASLIAEHGHVSYGGNSHLIADDNEAWMVIEFAGGEGLWAAERLGPDSIRVSRPGYIENIPPEGDGGRDFLWSPNFISFASEKGWYEAGIGTPFNVNTIYGDGLHRWAGVRWVEGELSAKAAGPQKIGIQDIMYFLRTERLTGDSAGYGQVVPLFNSPQAELRMIWHAHIGAASAPFTPVFLGINCVPEEFRQHRYLTHPESQLFIDARRPHVRSVVPRGIESTRSATQVFKRLQYLAFQHSDVFIPELHATWQAVENRLVVEVANVVKLAELALLAGERSLAVQYLTSYTEGELLKALDMAEKMAIAMELRTKVLFGISSGSDLSRPEQIW